MSKPLPLGSQGIKPFTPPVIAPLVAPKVDTKPALPQKPALITPDVAFNGLPASDVALQTSPAELSKVLDTASKAARTSAANLTGLVANLSKPTGRVTFDASLVDASKVGFGQGNISARDASFANSNPSLLKGVGPATAEALESALGVKNIRDLAAALAADLDKLAGVLTPANLDNLKSIKAKLKTYEDATPTVDIAMVSKVRARLEGTEQTIGTMAGLLEKNPVALSDALVRINATFQWIEQAGASLGAMTDAQLAQRVKGSPATVRAEMQKIRALVDQIGSKKDLFLDARTSIPEEHTHRKEVSDSSTALLTQPLDAVSPFTVKMIPNLGPKERIIEQEFTDAFRTKGHRMVREFLKNVKAGMYGPPNVIAPDDAKLLSPRYARNDVFAGKPVTALEELDPESKAKVQQSRAEANIPLHMTATVIARLALIQSLDDLAKDSTIPPEKKTLLVTCGGVAAGKGYAVKHASDKLGDLAKSAALVYDTDGETSGTFNSFVMKACQDRGIHPIFLYVHADANTAWERVLSRAAKEGRMVSEEPFLDSHVDSPRNFAAFHAANKDQLNRSGKAAATFVIIDNASGTPKLVDEVPPDALRHDRDELRNVIKQKTNTITEVPEFVIKTAKRGEKLWPERHSHGPRADAPR